MAIPVVCPEASRLPAERARFSRKSRLQKHADFEKVYNGGRRIFSANLTVFFLPRDEGAGLHPSEPKTGPPATPARVGFAVGRALGAAVARNRIRRRMREAVRLNLATLGGGVDVVVHPKKSALKTDFTALCEEVAKAFGRIRSSVVGPLDKLGAGYKRPSAEGGAT